VVEYPSPAAFIDMVTNEDYVKIHEYRAAALDRGDLIATSTWSAAILRSSRGPARTGFGTPTHFTNAFAEMNFRQGPKKLDKQALLC